MAQLAGRADSTHPELARRLWRAGVEREANLDTDSALVLYHAARVADPSYLAAQLDYFYLMFQGGAIPELRRELSRSDPRGGALTACLAEVTRLRRDDPDGAQRLVISSAAPGSNCPSTYASPFLYFWSEVGGRPLNLDAELLRSLPAFLRECPECWRLQETLAALLSENRRSAEASATIAEAISNAPNGYVRVELHIWSLQLDSPERRRSHLLSIEAAVARDTSPGVRMLFLHMYKGNEAARLARDRSDWLQEYQEAVAEGYKRVETGEPALGLSYLDRAITLADSIGRAPLQIRSYLNRGRAYVELGRLDSAERDLLHAIALGPAAEDPYYLRESWHNLAYVYERAGRFREAARTVDQFARLSRDPGQDARWLSLHDAGIIRWKAGWHAAARRDFEAMVQAIDEKNRDYPLRWNGHYYAGEYYESLGDLSRARAYYQAGKRPAPNVTDPQTLQGLVRVYEQLGQEDSAEATARTHDSHQDWWPATETPLLPRVLANRGRYPEAVRLARAWAERQAAGGHVPATTAARLELADLLLRWGKPDSALHEATEAERLAKSLTLTDELIRAGELRGRAFIAMGRSASGLQALRAAANLAAAHPTVESALTTQLALGDALAGAGETRPALSAYDVAARAVERVTDRLDLDLERAGYRDRHPLPFDGALRVLLRRNTPENLESMLLWSERRTGAALARATGILQTTRPVTLPEAQRRLGPHHALVDYLVVDSVVAAIVVTPRRAALVRLPITQSRLQALIDRVRRPLVTTSGGRIDLARARYDESAAHDLHAALLEPLDSLLAGCRSLAIVPDGPLAYLPFEALVTSKPGAGDIQYLIDRFEIVYLPSAAFLEPAGSSPRHLDPALRILAVENGVSAGAEEIAAIRAAWPAGAVTTLVGAQATESAVRAAAQSYGILHLATHAVADGRDALASHLELRPDDGNDGYLHINEIAAGRFRGRLVVLSGCETLVGPNYRGEGLMGLARAFLASGSDAVVASRWPVGPATAELMGGFYRRLAKGEELAGALRNAQLDLRRNPRTAHPFHWAGFVLVTGG